MPPTRTPGLRGSIRAMIEAFAGINDALFFIFIVAFFLGLLCYGVALSADKTSDRGMGFLFLTWAVLTLPAIIDAVRGVDSISGMFEWVGYGFQPNRTRFHWRVAVEEKFRPPPSSHSARDLQARARMTRVALTARKSA